MTTYKPTIASKFNLQQLQDWVTLELQRVSKAFQAFDAVQLNELHSEPNRLRSGMMVFADGTDWEPVTDGGQGIYAYYNSAWHKLG